MKKFILFFILLILWGCGADLDLINPETNFSQSTLDNLSINLSDEKGVLNFTISNNSEKNLFIYVSDLPLPDLEKDLFKITNGNEFIPYVGKMVTRIDSVDNWVFLESNSSITYNVNLDNFYDVKEPDYYEIYYDSIVSILNSYGNVEYLNLVSDSITTYITHTLKSVPERITCSSSQINLLNRGKNIGSDMTKGTKAYLAKKGADAYYKRWFGAVTTTRLNHVKDGFQKTDTSFGKGWEYSCEDKTTNSGCNGYAAWVYKNQPYKVWVCMNYYEGTSDDNRGTLMVHEASHWNVNFGSEDYGYGYDTGVNLAKSDPDKAVNCANNIEYYTWETYKLAPDDDPNPPDPPSTSNSLFIQNYMRLDDQLFSENGKYKFKLRSNGNIVLNEVGVKNLWRSGTADKGATILRMQKDGNLVLYNANHKPLWASNTNGKNVAKLQVLNTGKVVLKNNNGNIIWSIPNNDSDSSDPVEQVAIFGNINFQGYRVDLEAGRHYDLEDLKALGSPNDSISSIKVVQGFKAIVYQHHHFQGTSYEIIDDISDLRSLNFNDEISSIIIRHKDDDPDPPDEDWSFVVAGDTRTNDSAHRSVLKAIKNNTPNYELYLNSGDVVDDGTNSNQWNTFTNALNSILGSGWKNKYLACPGNHDKVNSGGLTNWRKYLPKQANYGTSGKYFSFKYKNATFLILDADGNKNTQATFIKNILANVNTTWIFAIWHYPTLYDQWINPLINAKFDGVFNGHSHIYDRTEKGNYFKTIVGTGGAPLSGNDPYGYLECKVTGNKMTVKFIKASSGQVLDSKTYTANNK